VPVDAADDAVAEYRRAEQGNPSTLTAPGTPGLYEVRYVLNEGRRPVARAMVEVVEPEVGLDVPVEVSAGGTVPVGVTGVVNGRDYVTLVGPDQPDDTLAGYSRAGQGGTIELAAPDMPGLYEVRYVLSQGRRVLARAPVEVVAVSATLDGPGEVVAGAPFAVGWDGPNRRNDRIVLVPAGAPDMADPVATADPQAPVDPVRLQAPEAPGAYELRYVLGSTDETVARQPLDVVRLAAGLTAPDTAAAGSTIEVGWTGPGGERDRITLAPAGDSDMTWAAAARTADGNPVSLTVPGTPGQYELRYLDVANRAVLVRQPLTVK
jgi:Ca-activated chloride channel family protein